jgi:hypothetical protein
MENNNPFVNSIPESDTIERKQINKNTIPKIILCVSISTPRKNFTTKKHYQPHTHKCYVRKD